MTLVIKNADEKIIREFKAEAAREGLSLSQAFEEAVRYWITFKDKEVVSEVEQNNAVYESMEKELKKFSGKYVVVARGKLVGVFDTLEETSKALKKLYPAPKHAIVVKVGFDDKVREDLEWLGGSIEQTTA